MIGAHASPWTFKLLRMLARHGERYRRYSMRLPGSARDVHAEHTEIAEAALAGKEARAALALEAHIRNTAASLVTADRAGVTWCDCESGAASSARDGSAASAAPSRSETDEH